MVAVLGLNQLEMASPHLLGITVVPVLRAVLIGAKIAIFVPFAENHAFPNGSVNASVSSWLADEAAPSATASPLGDGAPGVWQYFRFPNGSFE